MTIEAFISMMKEQCKFGDYIVTLKYKYGWEEKYCIENEVVCISPDHDYITWFNDWCEGQTDVEIIGFIAVEDVKTITIKEY